MLEKDIQLLICAYIRTKYPNVIFRSDFGSGMKMSIGMARRHKALQSSRAFPDLFIIEPRGEYAGLFIELKTIDNKVFKQDGALRKDQHLSEQDAMLKQLQNRGFMAKFAQGYGEAIKIIDDYLESN